MTRLERKILEALKKLAIEGPDDRTLGICADIAFTLDTSGEEYNEEELDDALTSAFNTWPEHSGNEAYPVGNWTTTPSQLFWNNHRKGVNMWNPDTHYGKARLSLLAHTITVFLKMEKQECSAT